MSDNLDEFARNVFEGQKFSTHLEAKLGPVSAGKAEISIELKDFHKQQHASRMAALSVTSQTTRLPMPAGLPWAAMRWCRNTRSTTSGRASGKTLVARAEAIAVGRSQAVCQSRVYGVAEDGTEKLCAIAQGTVVPAPNP